MVDLELLLHNQIHPAAHQPSLVQAMTASVEQMVMGYTITCKQQGLSPPAACRLW